MCRHTNCTLPMTPRSGPRAGRTYITCLSCSAELDYDWSNMRLGARIDVPSSGSVPRHAGPSYRQMLVAPFTVAVRLYRVIARWVALRVLPHLHPFPHWHSR